MTSSNAEIACWELMQIAAILQRYDQVAPLLLKLNKR